MTRQDVKYGLTQLDRVNIQGLTLWEVWSDACAFPLTARCLFYIDKQ